MTTLIEKLRTGESARWSNETDVSEQAINELAAKDVIIAAAGVLVAKLNVEIEVLKAVANKPKSFAQLYEKNATGIEQQAYQMKLEAEIEALKAKNIELMAILDTDTVLMNSIAAEIEALKEKLDNLAMCANTVVYCYNKRPENFAAALQDLESAITQQKG